MEHFLGCFIIPIIEHCQHNAVMFLLLPQMCEHGVNFDGTTRAFGGSAILLVTKRLTGDTHHVIGGCAREAGEWAIGTY